jgi:acyl-CoA thioesterase-1
MVKSFQAMKPQPEIFIMIPPPLYKDGVYLMNQTVINEIYPKLIPEIAKQANINGAHIVDLFGRMGGKDLSMPDLFFDGCHPNK